MKIVVVVDMQRDFVTGPLGSKEAQIAADNLKIFLSQLEPEDQVIFTQDTHYADYLKTQEGKNLPIPHCIKGTNGWEIINDLLNQIECDQVNFVEKETFGSTDVSNYIWSIKTLNSNVEEIIFCGVCTDICVISNALIVKADFPETPISVKANCCAGLTPEKHEAALSVMESCQIKIVRD